MASTKTPSVAEVPSITPCVSRRSAGLGWQRATAILGSLLLLTTFPHCSFATPYAKPFLDPAKQLVKDAVTAAASTVLQDFQVYPPVLTPLSDGYVLTNGSSEDPQATIQGQSPGCVTQQTLMVYSFANSYGQPFVGPYAPPDCDFNRVTLNLTVTAAGRQFDRLGLVYFGNAEIWRTSTAEPTAAGIIWTYIKDMSHLLALFKQPQTLIFDLGNIVDSTYTAPFNATLTATFFSSEDTVDPADMVLPVSGGNGTADQASAFQVPPQNATSALTLPRNINKAVFSISATGQINEEFWYTNVLSSEVNTFNSSGTTLLGYSPFREVQLFIDGTMAGVVWPFPIIFTGGIVPGFWRPIVGIDAFDLREDEIDITPWLPLLCDGSPHTFDIKIAGIDDDGQGNGQITESVGSYWVVTGKVFMWLDPEGAITTGSRPTISAPDPSIQLKSDVGKTTNGTNQTLTVDVQVQRQFTVQNTITTANGTTSPSWQQTLSYSNHDMLTNSGLTQYTTQDTQGTDFAPQRPYARKIDYPITVNSTFNQDAATGALSISGVLSRGENIFVAGSPVFPTGLQSFNADPEVHGSGASPQFQGSQLQTTQNGTAYYLNSLAANVSSGMTQQDMTFAGVRIDGFDSFPSVSGDEELYQRHVAAVNATVTEDSETLLGRSISDSSGGSTGPALSDAWAAPNAMKVLGRGPGSNTAGIPP